MCLKMRVKPAQHKEHLPTWLYLSLHGIYDYIWLVNNLVLPNTTLKELLDSASIAKVLLTCNIVYIFMWHLITNYWHGKARTQGRSELG